MNWVDLAVAGVVVLTTVMGVREGLAAGVADVLALVAALVAALPVVGVGATVLRRVGFTPEVAAPVALVALLLAWHALFTWLLRWPVRRLEAVVGDHGWHRVAGAVPGAVKGVLFCAALLTLIAVWPHPRLPKSAVERAAVGPPLVGAVQRLYVLLTTHARGLPSTLGLRILPDPNQRLDLHFRAERITLQPAAETRLVALINADRTRRGLPGYALDEALRAVARAHSADMLRRGYFGHVDPEGRSHVDRLNAVGVARAASAENVALAPGIAMLHEGLMNSPGHRANILSSEFERIGIGVQYSPLLGYVATQLFSD